MSDCRHGLAEGQCADCRQDALPDASHDLGSDAVTDWRSLMDAAGGWRTVAVFPARYAGRCGECGEEISEGEDVTMQVYGDDEAKRVLHEECVPWR